MNGKAAKNVSLSVVFAFVACTNITSAGDRADPDAAPEIIEEFDIAKDGDVIILPVTIRHKQYPFVLSVASTRTSIDERLRPLLGKRIRQIYDPPTSITYDEYPAIPMKIGSLSFTPAKPVLCGDIRDFRNSHGHEAYGIVGLDFLEGRVVQIDFDRGKLCVLNSFPTDLPLDSQFAPLTRDKSDSSGSYTIMLGVPGRARVAFFKVDTMLAPSFAAGPLLMEWLVRDRVVTELQPSYTIMSGAAQPMKRAGTLEKVSLSDFSHRNLSIYEQEDNRVGLAYLSRFKLTFEFRDEKYVYFSPGAKFADPELLNWSGMELMLKDGRVMVALVLPDSVAAKAGVEIGDVIVQLDGHKPQDFSLFEIRKYFVELNWVHVKFQRRERNSRRTLAFAVALESPTPIPPISRPKTPSTEK